MRAAQVWSTLPVPQPRCRSKVARSINLKLEMETAKSLREISIGVIPQVTNFWLLAEGPKCRQPHSGNIFYPR